MSTPKRRAPVRSALCLALTSLLAVLGACAPAPGPEAPAASAPEATGAEPLATPRPNIVFILADDLDARTSPFWDVMTLTRE
ncbi:MAG TPA: hypothetical protein VE153_10545, partial [Myxococcus sp.]|nr:hypothetical protein [Myxococcus sp.]